MKNTFAAILLFFSLSELFAQSSELGVFVGGSNYSGDLNSDVYTVKFIHPAVGLIYRHNWNPHYSFKSNVYYGTVSAYDVKSSDANLSFESTLIEGSAQIEFNFFPYEIGSIDLSPATPYVFTGLAGFYFNPKSENGAALQPVQTEGVKYSLIQVAIPMGMGLKFLLGNFTLGLEAGARKTFTDYLDDVSTIYVKTGRQRGNSQDKDWYMFGGITLTVKISGKPKVHCDAFDRKY